LIAAMSARFRGPGLAWAKSQIDMSASTASDGSKYRSCWRSANAKFGRSLLRENCSSLLLHKRIRVQQPCAAEQSARRLHFHIDLIFPRLIAEDFYGEPLRKLPGIPVRKHFVLVGRQRRGIAAFLQLLLTRELVRVLKPDRIGLHLHRSSLPNLTGKGAANQGHQNE
jgi:hypothetical protein